MLIGEFLSFFG